MKDKLNIIPHTIKDIVFQEAIATEENLPEIYNSIYPENSDIYDSENFVLSNIHSVLINSIVNDLSFYSIKENKMIFLEAVADWSKIDFRRFGEYVLEVLVRFGRIKEDFSSVDVDIDFFILVTSSTGPDKKVFKLYDLLNNDNQNKVLDREINFHIISRKNQNIIKGKILEEYFRFCEIQKEVYLKKGRTKEALEEIVNRCIKEKVLADFLEKHKEEVVISFDDINYQEKIIERLIEKEKQEGIEKGKIEGIEKGKIEKGNEIYQRLINNGMNSDEANAIVYGD